MVEACKEAGDSKIKCKPQNKWFDQECETEKENSQSLGENISHNIRIIQNRDNYSETKKRVQTNLQMEETGVYQQRHV